MKRCQTITESRSAHTADDFALDDKAILVSREAFLRDLRMDKPELAEVKAALDTADLDAAGKAYIAYFRAKPMTSRLWADWSTIKRDPKYDTKGTDQLLAGHFRDGYNVYDIPPSGIDWRNCPLTCITRFPVMDSLRSAIHHTQDPRYVRFFVNHVLDYMSAYPIDEFIGKGTQGFINDYTVIRPWHWCMLPPRIGQIAESMSMIRSFPEVSDEELLTILQRMYQETIYVRLHMKEWVNKRHNGGLCMIKGMTAACKMLEDCRATDEWSDYNARMMTQYINESFYPDGQCIEMTVAYSASVVMQTQQLAFMLQDIEGIKTAKPKLKAMSEWCVGISKPTGHMPSFGDLQACDLRQSMYEPILDWINLPYAKTIAFGAEGPLPPHTVYPAPSQPSWGGYYAMRSNWNRNARYLCIDAGPWGTSHQHGDKLSFVVSAHGADFIVDPSSTKYRNNESDAFISTQRAGFLHNTVTIDGVDEFMNEPREVKEPLANTWQHGPRHTLFEGDYSFKPLKPVTWKRRVVFVNKAYWLLQDVLLGDQTTAAVEQNFQFDKNIKTEFIENNVTVATAPNGAKLLLVPLTDKAKPVLSIGDERERMTYWHNGEPTLNQGVKAGREKAPHARGWIGHDKKLLPAPAVTYTDDIKLPTLITFAIVPIAPGQEVAAPKITSQVERDKTVWLLPMDSCMLIFTSSAEACTVNTSAK